MNRVRTQDDHRIVEETDYKGHHIRVVCAYNGVEDNYFVHLYISTPGGPEIRVFKPARTENNSEDALDLGFFAGQSEIDQLTKQV